MMTFTECQQNTELWKELHNDSYRISVAQRPVERAPLWQVQSVSIKQSCGKSFIMSGTEYQYHAELWNELHNVRYRMSVSHNAVDRAS